MIQNPHIIHINNKSLSHHKISCHCGSLSVVADSEVWNYSAIQIWGCLQKRMRWVLLLYFSVDQPEIISWIIQAHFNWQHECLPQSQFNSRCKISHDKIYSQDLKLVTPQCLISTHLEIHQHITMCSSVGKTTTLIDQPPQVDVFLWTGLSICQISCCFLSQEAISITTGLTHGPSLWTASSQFTPSKSVSLKFISILP